MIRPAPRRPGGGRRRPFGVVALLVGLVVLVASSLAGIGPASAGPARVAATGGCRAVGSGAAPSGGGPDRATVVVDTGSGAVWSACVSFSGSISGIEALERARDVITDLNPVYDQYSGLGKAVCRLRGVGTDPPDCLGKSVNYWSLSVNGRVAPVGAGAVTLEDGDVEGWRYGSGGTPRAASAGTEAAAAPAVTTTRPPATTQPSAATTLPGGGSMTGATTPDGSPAAPSTTRPGETTTTVKGQTTTPAPGATTPSTTDGHTTQLAAASGDGDAGAAGGRDESAAGAVASGSTSGGSSGGGSSLPTALAFAAVIGAIGIGAVLIRRRRAAPIA